jgi:hypothetical protein
MEAWSCVQIDFAYEHDRLLNSDLELLNIETGSVAIISSVVLIISGMLVVSRLGTVDRRFENYIGFQMSATVAGESWVEIAKNSHRGFRPILHHFRLGSYLCHCDYLTFTQLPPSHSR